MASILSLVRNQPTVRWAAGGWIFFILENAILSENRTWLIQELGDEQYHAVYGTFSTIATGSIGYAYYKINKSKLDGALKLWKTSKPPVASAIGGFVVLSLGLVMASQTLPKFQVPFAFVEANAASSNGGSENLPSPPPPPSDSSWKVQVRCPFDFADGKRQDGVNAPVHGLDRISRHPGLWSFGLIGLGQAALASSVPMRIWWTGPAAIAWLGGAHTDSRFRRGMGGTLDPHYDSQTSNIPFTAILTGKQGSRGFANLAEESKPLNMAFAVLASGLWVARKVR